MRVRPKIKGYMRPFFHDISLKLAKIPKNWISGDKNLVPLDNVFVSAPKNLITYVRFTGALHEKSGTGHEIWRTGPKF
jgi:hypothetical protein